VERGARSGDRVGAPLKQRNRASSAAALTGLTIVPQNVIKATCGCGCSVIGPRRVSCNGALARLADRKTAELRRGGGKIHLPDLPLAFFKTFFRADSRRPTEMGFPTKPGRIGVKGAMGIVVCANKRANKTTL